VNEQFPYGGIDGSGAESLLLGGLGTVRVHASSRRCVP
jgi:hypothetical protein